MSEDRKVVRVSAESEGYIRGYANRRGMLIGEAADALIAMAIGRLAALARYAETKKPMPPGPRKKKPKPPPKKRKGRAARAKTSASPVPEPAPEEVSAEL